MPGVAKLNASVSELVWRSAIYIAECQSYTFIARTLSSILDSDKRVNKKETKLSSTCGLFLYQAVCWKPLSQTLSNNSVAGLICGWIQVFSFRRKGGESL